MAVASHIFSVAVKGTLAMVEASLALNQLLTTPKEGSEKALQTASAVNKLVLLGFSIAEIGALIGGADSKSLMHLKSFELLPRAAEVPIESSKYIIESIKNPSAENHIRLFEKGLVAPDFDT